MGTMLQRAGLAVGDFPEIFNFTHPHIVKDIFKTYISAGAQILTSNTFSSNEYKLKGFQHSVEASIEQGIRVAREAGPDRLVALDMGPIGQLMEPMGTLRFDDAYRMFAQQVRAGAAAGADLIIIETMSDLYEMKAAVLAAHENSSLPVVCTMTFQQDGRTLAGTDPRTAVTVLQNLGVAALGMNCSLGPAEMLPIVEEYITWSRVPVIVQPNAGMPRLVAGETVYDMTPDEFGSKIETMARAGVRIFGGCCGTSPEFIQNICKRLEGVSPGETAGRSIAAVTSGTRTAVIESDDIVVIGERINPTGKKKLKEALRTNNMTYILNEAVSQRDAGADILDVNCGMPEIDEREMMVRVIREIQAVVDLPLQIDSTKPEVIEAGVRCYNGSPLINSVNGEQKSLETVLPVAKKYGACVLGLTLDENGIPETAEGRFAIAEKIVAAAASYGLPHENLLIDCLVLTASAQQSAVMETLKALRMVKDRLGLRTVLGISNVSFGLPRRDIINRTYLAMACACGLNAPILNPLSGVMMETVHAYRVLANRDAESSLFIQRYADTTAPSAGPQAPSSSGAAKTAPGRTLQEIIINGLQDMAAETVTDMLEAAAPMSIIDEHLMPALDEVGRRYEKGELFLPQLIQAAETVKKAFEIVKEHLHEDESTGIAARGRVVIATVKGDIHDIGKNIVKVLLENYGFDVIDLGKDVPAEDVVSATRRHGVKLVGLSALMTTTVESMKETIVALRAAELPCRIMVGGAVLTSDYAEMIEADYFARDAQAAVTIAKRVHRNSPD